jgi:hypothetical protein
VAVVKLEQVLACPVGRFLTLDDPKGIQVRPVLQLHPEQAAQIGALVIGPNAPDIDVPKELSGAEPSFSDALDPSLQLRQGKIFDKDSFHV